MTRNAPLLALLATVLVSLLPAAPAQAQRARVFVASYGSDSNPCTFGSPCKTFQNAVNVVATGGEVTAIDSAGFGPIVISHAVTITSPNGVEAGIAAPASGGTAIFINAGSSDVISLNGLTLDGDNVSGAVGIGFNTGGTLHVQNCTIRNFGFYGISVAPQAPASMQFSVSSTLLSDNGGYGVFIYPNDSGTIVGVLDNVEMENNGIAGLLAESNSASVNVTVTDSVSANNQYGIFADSFADSNIKIMVRNSTLANNTDDGLIAAYTGTVIRVTRSTITDNGTAWAIKFGSSSNGSVTSFGTNAIIGNTAGNPAPPKPTLEQ